MQAWQIVATVAAVVFPVLGLLNAYLLNQVRLAIADLKLQMVEARTQDSKDLRTWVDAEFLRRESALARHDALVARIRVIEIRLHLGDGTAN